MGSSGLRGLEGEPELDVMRCCICSQGISSEAGERGPLTPQVKGRAEHPTPLPPSGMVAPLPLEAAISVENLRGGQEEW